MVVIPNGFLYAVFERWKKVECVEICLHGAN